MPVNQSDLFDAILAMNTYQTGADGAINHERLGNDHGIGTANVIDLSTTAHPNTGADAPFGFFAQAYRLSDGSTVIAYRGTDQGFGLSSPDFKYGFGVGA